MSKECHYCGFRDPMPFTCKFCGKSFCYNHRLPESHNCPGLAVYKERVRTSGKLSHYEPGQTLKKRRNPVFRSVFNAFSIIKSNYSLTILTIAIISFVLQYIIGYRYFSYFALFPQDIFDQQLKFALNLVTHMFLHLNFEHLLLNMIFLFFIGPELERRIGGRKFLAVFFLSGVIAGIGYTMWSILTNNIMSSAVGASGALFGIFACLMILAPDMQLYIYFIPMKITHALVFFAVIDLALGLLMGSADPVGRSAHLTGIAAGLIIGIQIKKKGKYIR